MGRTALKSHTSQTQAKTSKEGGVNTPEHYRGDASFSGRIRVSEITASPANPRLLDLQRAGINAESIKPFRLDVFVESNPEKASSHPWKEWMMGLITKESKSEPRVFEEWVDLIDLAVSIRDEGVIDPITIYVGPDNDKREIMDGERRWLASRIACLEFIPALKRQVITAEDRVKFSYTANTGRHPSKMAIADSFRRNKLYSDISVREIEKISKVGRTSSNVIHRFIRLTEKQASEVILSASRQPDISWSELDRIIGDVSKGKKTEKTTKATTASSLWKQKIPPSSAAAARKFYELVKASPAAPQLNLAMEDKPMDELTQADINAYLKALISKLEE